MRATMHPEIRITGMRESNASLSRFASFPFVIGGGEVYRNARYHVGHSHIVLHFHAKYGRWRRESREKKKRKKRVGEESKLGEIG